MKKIWILTLVALVSITANLQAEADILEAAAPPGLHLQYFNIYQHADSFARDDIGITDFKLDVDVNLFRVANWWDNGVVHAILPYGYIDQEASVNPGPGDLVSDSKWDFGDAFIGGAYRWHSKEANNMENPDFKWWTLAGADFRIPTGNYSSECDPGTTDFTPDNGVNFGTGSFSFQPFVILSTLFNKGMLGTDTEIRWDFNTKAGPIQYNPDDKLEIWQTLHMGLSKNLRVGAAIKGEFEVSDEDEPFGAKDHDRAFYVGIGPEVMWTKGNFVIWGKVLFDVATNDTAEKIITAYVRAGWKF